MQITFKAAINFISRSSLGLDLIHLSFLTRKRGDSEKKEKRTSRDVSRNKKKESRDLRDWRRRNSRNSFSDIDNEQLAVEKVEASAAHKERLVSSRSSLKITKVAMRGENGYGRKKLTRARLISSSCAAFTFSFFPPHALNTEACNARPYENVKAHGRFGWRLMAFK